MVFQATNLSFPHHSLSSPPPHITSLLFEPISLSLALMHSDSSFSLYPSMSPFSVSSLLPTPQNLIPPPSSSSTFLLIRQNPNLNPRVLFLVSGPYRGGSQILLRFYILQKSNSFNRAQVVCTQKNIQFHQKLGVLVNVNHGVSIKLAGATNYFAMYSISNSKIWVFAVRMVGGENGDDDDDGVVVKLMRCAVIECCKPVWSISVSFGSLILGEDNGVRVFNLRLLVKSGVRKVRNLSSLASGASRGIDGNHDSTVNVDSKSGGSLGDEGSLELNSNGYLDGKTDKHYVSMKQSSAKFRQNSGEWGACFVAFNNKEVEDSKSPTVPMMSMKAISIQAQSPTRFFILDSTGDLHLLCVINPVAGSDTTCHMRQFPHIMKVQKLAIFPDISSRIRTLWISDGNHSLHMVALSNMDNAFNENNRNESEEKLIQISVIQAIFSSEKIQDVIPLSANAILLLGQGSIYAYANF